MSVIVQGGGGKSSGLYVWKKYKVASLISFSMADANNVSYIAGTYQAEEGMTWGQWVNSSYNTGGFIKSGDDIYKPSGRLGFVYDNVAMANVKVTDTIVSSRVYVLTTGSIG